MTASKPEKAPQRFIQRLKQALDEHPEKLSLRQLAHHADLSPAYLSLLLNGERAVPSTDAITRLEQVLNLKAGELFEAAGRPSKKALEFFRKDEAAAIMQTLARVPAKQLPEVRTVIERFLSQKPRKTP